MSQSSIIKEKTLAPSNAQWSAVFSLSFSVVCLVTAELLPISLLTPIASALNVSEGMAGQAVTATSVVGMIASLFIAAATRRLDRRLVLLMFTLIYIVSNTLVSISSSYPTLIAGRVLLGVSLGGFWSMAAAIAMRLVPEASIPRALSIIFGGVSIAMAIAAPLGTWLGGLIGWRGVFDAAALLGVVGLVWQWRVLPQMQPRSQSSLGTLFSLLKRPQIGAGMLGMALVFGGHFAFFTYLRPFLEQAAGFGVNGVSTLLFCFGVANIAGTSFAGMMLARSLRMTLALMPLCMSALAFALVVIGQSTIIVALLVVVWGFLFGAVPVAWTTWLTRAVPDETESGGGLQVAAIQLAVTVGAGMGGFLIDRTGAYGAIIGSAVTLICAAALILFRIRPAMNN
ncbi:MFS transporter [Rouxiella silvae]|jgi:predicted MFS family arabinose efflux permease|uniref:MFS transporter n=1 Tax=Rouxiella silvae TaxID=1646373 RepID=A0ABX3TXM0_9GAMM|nr:MFS transporter [Rouxiella silvae]ORJ19961.1 MFS transporter [Rouxiella silvae]